MYRFGPGPGPRLPQRIRESAGPKGLIVLVLRALVKAQVIRFGKPNAESCSAQANQGVLQVPCIPTACVEHIAEKQRSLSNEENIKKLWENSMPWEIPSPPASR
jgi:hypothetical protein